MLAIRSHPETWDVVELSLEPHFDRALGQFERAQRVRLGQPVLPKLEVSYSVSRIMRGRERRRQPG